MDKTQTEYVVKTSRAKMPSSCWGKYSRVAVLEVVRGTSPKQISTHARGVVRVVHTWEKLYDGSTARCARARAESAAAEMAAALNAGQVNG